MSLTRFPGCKFRFCIHQMIWYWYHMSRPGFLKRFDAHNHAYRQFLLNLGFLCHMPSITKRRVFCLRPPLPLSRMSRTTFHVRGTVYWNLLCLFRGGGGGPSPKVRTFCNSGWPDSGKFWGSIAYPYSTSLCPYSPKTEKTWKNNKKGCSDWDYNQSHALS